MAVGINFRLHEEDRDYLYWVTIHCTSGQEVTSSAHPVHLDHLEFDERVRERGWVRAQPQLLLLLGRIRRAVLDCWPPAVSKAPAAGLPSGVPAAGRGGVSVGKVSARPGHPEADHPP